MRTLFLALHKNELDEQQLSELDGYHNLSEVFPFEVDRDYSGYYKFGISRNPYNRIVSAFLDQYVYHRHSRVDKMLEAFPPKDGKPNTFIEFLEYLETVPDHLRDSHFQTQSFFNEDVGRTKRLLFGGNQKVKSLDHIEDISCFDDSMKKVYKIIFEGNDKMHQRALDEIADIEKINSLIYSDNVPDNAADLTLDQITGLPFAPVPQYFFNSARAKKLVRKIYALDFKSFNYSQKEIPIKKPSLELNYLPSDFDWQNYLLLNPDLERNGLTTERRALQHYLLIGRNEENTRYYKVEAPDWFDWNTYLQQRADLVAAGINTERDALIHYLSYGKNEQTINW